MKKLQILIIAFLISLSICAFASTQVKAAVSNVVVSPAGPVMMDVGQSKVFTVSSSGGIGSISYKWYLDSSEVGSDNSVYSYSPSSSSGSHSITASVSDSDFPFPSNAVSVTVNAALVAPIVTSTPGTVNQGQASSLASSAVSTGTSPYTYQWLSKAPGAGSYSLIGGATSSSYSFVTTSSTATGSWSFELQVTDAVLAVVTSNAVSVMVNAAPTVVVSPASWIMDVGQSKIFSASASGGSGSYPSTGYHWYVGGSVQSGATESTFSFSPVSSGSYLITVSVTDSLGTTSAQSSAASVTVNSALVGPTLSVSANTVDRGQTSSLTSSSLSTGTSPYTYQWLQKAPGGSYSLISGATSNSYSFVTTSSTATGSWSFELQVTDDAGVSVTSSAVSVMVNAALVAPIVTSTPGTVNQGQASSLASSVVSMGTSPYTYQWLSKAPGAGSYSLIGGATSNNYNFVTSIATATGNWSFILQVKDSVGEVVNSSALSVIVNIPPLDHFVFSSVGTQTAGTSFSITITAKDSSNNTLTNYVGSNTLNISTGIISPISTGVFLSGVWTGSVNVTGAGSGVTIFTTGSSMSGTSSIFNVNPGPLNRFTSGPIGSPQTVGSAFSITVVAKDVYGNNVTTYIGTPSLAVSVGAISPISMNAFVNGVGTTSAMVSGAGSDVTITATDGSNSGTSNPFTVTIEPTSSPTVTPTSTSSPTSTPTSTYIPKASPTPTITQSPSPTPLATIVSAKTDSGSIVELAIKGNVTNSQISNATITSYQSTKTTTVSFTITGPNASTGFSNMTIPKTAIPYGTTLIIYVDGQQATSQGYVQDVNNFYVWYTTQFSTHQVKVQFAESSAMQAISFGSILAVGVTVPEIVLIYTVIAIRRLKRKPENS
jgi:hypothetical protein